MLPEEVEELPDPARASMRGGERAEILSTEARGSLAVGFEAAALWK